ncbi:MAG: prepilin-type N-terminal cleavage/methylation domain-containing protein [Planctomycetes bacterium]|nr:prepilin-type N-terminal cleavage/methylation domain-containing protein [Planctomycetota bacterium]
MRETTMRKLNAFTLVELLVVISIITILAGLLLPALSMAIDSAKAVACVNNQKQLALGLGMYADDWNDNIVRNWQPPTWGDVLWPPFLSGKQGPASGTPRTDANGPVYIEKGPIYMCPKGPRFSSYSKNVGGGGWMAEVGYGMYQPSNEVYNYKDASYWSFRKTYKPQGNQRPYIYTYKLTAVKSPATLILMADTVTGSTAARAGAPSSTFAPSYESKYNARIHLVHGGQANCLFFDSHVKTMSMVDINKTDSHPTQFWLEDGVAGFSF